MKREEDGSGLDLLESSTAETDTYKEKRKSFALAIAGLSVASFSLLLLALNFISLFILKIEYLWVACGAAGAVSGIVSVFLSAAALAKPFGFKKLKISAMTLSCLAIAGCLWGLFCLIAFFIGL